MLPHKIGGGSCMNKGAMKLDGGPADEGLPQKTGGGECVHRGATKSGGGTGRSGLLGAAGTTSTFK